MKGVVPLKKDNLWTVLVKEAVLFCFFAAMYYGIETIWKYPTPSHWSMAVIGGLAGVIIGGFNNFLPWEMPFWRQCFYGGIVITIFEGLSGIVLNRWLGLGIWDYSKVPFNFFFEQCCLPFCAVWVALSALGIWLDDWLRWKLFGERRKPYKLI